MSTKTEIRSVERPGATEIYISSAPGEPAPLQSQARAVFSEIRQALDSRNAHILQERVFGTVEGLEAARQARSNAYGRTDDGVPASFLAAGKGAAGPIAGVQIHAVAGHDRPEVVRADGKPCGRIFRASDRTCLTLSSISAAKAGPPTEQARAMMEKAESILKQYGADFLCVPRTWMWLGDILSWYDDFNRVRNEFFRQRGLIGEGTRQSMPASTGIGLYPFDGSKCAMDLTAVLQPTDSTRYLQAVGRQQCALEYGSAFSRASLAVTPAGQTIFVSGTASIDASGATTNIGDASGQIHTTIENVRAVLADMQAGDEDIVQAVIYCKTTEVERIFLGLKDTVAWPCVTVICDICRPDLLFEIEATAIRRPT